MGRLSRGAVALLLMIAAPAATAPPPPPSVQAGVEAWRVGDYAVAVEIWRPFAQAGDPDALFNLGQAYKLGRGVPKDLGQARNYYRQAANRGSLPAQANLGILLFQAGEKPEAMRWLRQAADRGEMRAQYVLGVALYNGDGAPRSIPSGYAYLLRARAAGLPQAGEMLRSIEPLLSPADRARGESLAAMLAAGGTIPAGFAGAPAPGAAPPPVVAAPRIDPPAARAAPRAELPRPPVPAGPQPRVDPDVTSAAKPAPPPATAEPAPKPAEPAPKAAAPEPAPPAPAKPEAKKAEAAKPEAAKPEAKKAETKKPETKKAEARPSGWRVQLGAFSTRAQAEAAWKGVKAKDRAAAGGKPAVYDASGSIVKLQMGPYPDKAAAREACDALSAAGKACFVTKD